MVVFTGIYKFGSNAYPRRIRRRSNLGHIFRGKKCVLWAGKYGKCAIRSTARMPSWCEQTQLLPHLSTNSADSNAIQCTRMIRLCLEAHVQGAWKTIVNGRIREHRGAFGSLHPGHFAGGHTI